MNMELIFATNNRHKIREISSLLEPGTELIGLTDVNITEDIPEDWVTLEENALFKARFVHRRTGMNVFADDTGLEVEALNGAPGVHSARFAGEERDSSANMTKLLRLLEGKKNRKARFRTVIALIYGGSEYLFEGSIAGRIIEERKGIEGFGYDPVFIAEGNTLTFAEMSLPEKNKISHRARAFEGLRKFLAENGEAK